MGKIKSNSRPHAGCMSIRDIILSYNTTKYCFLPLHEIMVALIMEIVKMLLKHMDPDIKSIYVKKVMKLLAFIF